MSVFLRMKPFLLQGDGAWGTLQSTNEACSRGEKAKLPPLAEKASYFEDGSDGIDTVGQYAAANRKYISPELERKLRAASYSPLDNPDDISAAEIGRAHV